MRTSIWYQGDDPQFLGDYDFQRIPHVGETILYTDHDGAHLHNVMIVRRVEHRPKPMVVPEGIPDSDRKLTETVLWVDYDEG